LCTDHHSSTQRAGRNQLCNQVHRAIAAMISAMPTTVMTD
jgi:hypothetical protein